MAPYKGGNQDIFGSMMHHHQKISEHMDAVAKEMMGSFGMRKFGDVIPCR